MDQGEMPGVLNMPQIRGRWVSRLTDFLTPQAETREPEGPQDSISLFLNFILTSLEEMGHFENMPDIRDLLANAFC